MLFDLERLDRIKDRIGVLGDNAQLQCGFIKGEWHFLLDGKRVTYFCSMPGTLEFAEQNREAKLQFAKHLYREGIE